MIGNMLQYKIYLSWLFEIIFFLNNILLDIKLFFVAALDLDFFVDLAIWLQDRKIFLSILHQSIDEKLIFNISKELLRKGSAD